ncbi:MAG: ABC transporter ATP-binding protein [Ardenticatenaceae bacterium]|nr:ABC transporter ATP-binding protein [Ardenticatenaceae bacterium]
MQKILDVKGLKTRFHTQDGTVHAVNGVSFDVAEGELLGVVGESGSGKSVTMMSLLKLIPIPPGDISSGTAEFNGADLLQMKDEEIRDIRGSQIGFIFQDPMTSLNPVLSVGHQIMEPLRAHLGMSKEQAQARAVEMLKLVGIPSAADRLADYPHQFSGGMRQRVMIAIALACTPQLLFADEPTTALDVTIQAQILDLIKRLRKELGMAIVWISHDLGVVAGIADRVMVMYGGQVVERADVKELYASPKHPYTLGLLGSLPRLDDAETRLTSIDGRPPNLLREPLSCPFAPRCQYAYDRCHKENPALEHVKAKLSGNTHEVACWWDVEGDAPRYGS